MSAITESELIDPANGAAFTTVPRIAGGEAAAIVARAVDAQPSWAATPLPVRAQILLDAAERLRAARVEIVSDLAREGGKVRSEAEGEVEKSIDTFRYYAGLAGGLDGRSFSGGRPGLRHEIRIEPVGVVLAITPWNVPMASPARKIAPALLAGNAIIVKPAERTPLSSLHLRAALDAAGVPNDVVQVATGSGSDLGNALVLAERVDAVSFTGSTVVGMDIKQKLSDRLTRLQLELGGKNAAIVMPDADLQQAVNWITVGAFAGTGQQCTGTSRVIVHKDIAEQFVSMLEAAIDNIHQKGSSSSPVIGPLISQLHRQTVHGFVSRALDEGAKVTRGGTIPQGSGYFYPPTLIVDAARDSEINIEEVFGPVVTVIVANDLEDAIHICNNTSYGLSAAVHTRDLGVAETVAAATVAGVVAINGPTSGIELPAPFGGFKLSGTESKEHGPESLRFYTRTKLVSWGQP